MHLGEAMRLRQQAPPSAVRIEVGPRRRRQTAPHTPELAPEAPRGLRRRPPRLSGFVRRRHGQPSTRRSFDSGASSPGKTFFTPSPMACSMMRMSRHSEMKPLGSSDAAWSEPHMVRSSVM